MVRKSHETFLWRRKRVLHPWCARVFFIGVFAGARWERQGEPLRRAVAGGTLGQPWPSPEHRPQPQTPDHLSKRETGVLRVNHLCSGLCRAVCRVCCTKGNRDSEIASCARCSDHIFPSTSGEGSVIFQGASRSPDRRLRLCEIKISLCFLDLARCRSLDLGEI